jgi:malonate transporter and related proteins
VVATLAGVAGAALEFRPPEALDRFLTFLRGAAAPCALFALGVTVALRPLRRIPGELPVLVVVKLALHPLLVYLLLTWMGDASPVWLNTAVLLAALPPAATIYVIAAQYDTYVMRASSAILIGTAVSVLTVTGVLYLITHDMLPLRPFGR